MNNTKTLFAIAIFSLLFSCSNTTHEETNVDQNHHKPAQNETNELRLNNGSKWAVNEEMKPFLLASENLLNAYIETGDQEHKALAAALKVENDNMIKSCTMDGEPHDQLHLWLYPHLVMVKSLSETDNLEKSQGLVKDLSASFQVYHQYFE